MFQRIYLLSKWNCIHYNLSFIIFSIGLLISSNLILAQASKYDSQSTLGLLANMRNRGIEIESSERTTVDLFQLSKRILEYYPIDCYRLAAEDRTIVLKDDSSVLIVLKSREWMRINAAKDILCEPIVNDLQLQLVMTDNKPIEIVVDKMEIVKIQNK